MRYITDILIIILLVSLVCLWAFLGFKVFAFAFGLWSLFMYVTISVSNLSNALLHNGTDGKFDLFWRYLFSFLATIFLTLCIFI